MHNHTMSMSIISIKFESFTTLQVYYLLECTGIFLRTLPVIDVDKSGQMNIAVVTLCCGLFTPIICLTISQSGCSSAFNLSLKKFNTQRDKISLFMVINLEIVQSLSNFNNLLHVLSLSYSLNHNAIAYQL